MKTGYYIVVFKTRDVLVHYDIGLAFIMKIQQAFAFKGVQNRKNGS